MSTFFLWCLIFRNWRPKWQPRNFREWRSLWGPTVLMTAPWLPTERFTTRKTMTPLTKTDPGRPELGKLVWPWPESKQALDLVNGILQTQFSLQGQSAWESKEAWCALARRIWCVRRSWRIWMTGWQNQLSYFHGLQDKKDCSYIKFGKCFFLFCLF